MPVVRDFRPFVDGLVHEAKARRKALMTRATKKIKHALPSTFQDPYKKDSFISGRSREDMLFHVLDNTVGYGNKKLVRSNAQKDFHRLMFLANIEHIYKDDLAANIADIKRRHHVKGDFKSIVAIMSFRRGGKTTGLTMFATAFMIAVEEGIQALFSTGARASQLALNLVFGFVCSYDNGSWRRFVETKNKETLRIRISDRDLRIFNALPSDAKISNMCSLLCVCYNANKCV